MIARMRDVAERAQVSIATVSIYLNRPHEVGARSAERIRQAIDELGFVRNDAARQLRRGTSRTLAFIAFDVGDPFTYTVARGARRRAAEAGLLLVIADSEGDLAVEADYLRLFEEQRVRGVLFSSANPHELTENGSVRVPLVMLDHRPPAGTFASVSVDNVRGGELAAEHLLAIGRRRLAFVGGPLGIQQISERVAGARAAVGRVANATFELISTVERDVDAGREVAESILARPAARRPDAAFCVNDTMAIGMLQRFGDDPTARVPDDIAVIGYNDAAFDRYPSLPLSSVRQPHERFGEAAVELLLAPPRTRTEGVAPAIVFEPELIVRASTVRR